jgi:hypothetical protein
MFKEVSAVQVGEVLRRWLATGEGLRCLGTGAGGRPQDCPPLHRGKPTPWV